MDLKKSAVVFDIDNTILDTAVRKHELLKRDNIKNISLEEIRHDFWLINVFKDSTSRYSKKFFSELEDQNIIRDIKIPLLDESIKTVIKFLSEKEVEVVFLSSRPEHLLEVTEEELESLGIKAKGHVYLSKETDFQADKSYEFNNQKSKSKELTRICKKYNVIALVGDRPSDIDAAISHYIPAVLLTSTVNEKEEKNIREKHNNECAGNNNCVNEVAICNDWNEVERSIIYFFYSSSELSKMRDEFIQNYASWLSDIDSKIKTVVSIASVVMALTAKLMFDDERTTLEVTILGVGFLCSAISFLFSIRGLTSRETSGKKAGANIHGTWKKMLSILFNVKSNWLIEDGNAIDDWTKLQKHVEISKNSTNIKDSDENDRMNSPNYGMKSHQMFFYNKYKTLDYQIVRNLRLLELRKINYEKAFAEQYASLFLIASSVILITWTIFQFNYISELSTLISSSLSSLRS